MPLIKVYNIYSRKYDYIDMKITAIIQYYIDKYKKIDIDFEEFIIIEAKIREQFNKYIFNNSKMSILDENNYLLKHINKYLKKNYIIKIK